MSDSFAEFVIGPLPVLQKTEVTKKEEKKKLNQMILKFEHRVNEILVPKGIVHIKTYSNIVNICCQNQPFWLKEKKEFEK